MRDSAGGSVVVSLLDHLVVFCSEPGSPGLTHLERQLFSHPVSPFGTCCSLSWLPKLGDCFQGHQLVE